MPLLKHSGQRRRPLGGRGGTGQVLVNLATLEELLVGTCGLKRVDWVAVRSAGSTE